MAKINFLGNIESSEIINRFNSDDLSLTGTQIINSNFNPDTDYIEYVIYDTAGNFLNIDYSYTNYKLPNNSSLNVGGSYPQLDIEPIEDLRTYSDYGEFISQYSFFKPQISDVVNQDLFIKEISPDRTEIKVASVNLTKTELENQTRALINDKDSVPYLKTYLLNFGLNDVYVITNIALDTTNPIESYIYFKLYEPLPSNIAEKAQFCVVEEITNSYKFNINLATEILPDPLPQLKGPNFDVDINFKKNTLPTQYESYSTLLQFTGSSLHAILNHLDQTSIDINVDYTDFTNFSRFGSAQKRVENFYYKVKQIEDYNNFITTYTPFVATTASLQLQINQYSSSINDIVSKFDGYESYLYLQTGSNTYPHSNNTVPYIQQSTGSAAAIAWYTAQTDAAIYYDTNNQDNLVFLIPEYIRIDENNAPYLTFVNMIGQYFDNIYIYLKSVTDLYKSYNNLEEGVSKDLVYYALQDLGVDIYNSNEDDDLSTYAIAVSGSNIPSKDLVAELYKRIYHNIPLLFKGKGSRRGMQELITTFGITGSILNIKEYGGDSNTQASLIDYSNSKVRIIDNSIYNQSYYGATGSVLSPDIRLSIDNTYTNYKNDSDRVDISFSPYNQIDTTISASIATTYPTFSIDDYIGDPRNASQTEYGVLNSIRETAIDSSFTFKYDINGFIQLIKFFDNTLFKMLKSYIPAKANLNEGITIRQQALERIKFKRNEPNVTEQTVYDAEYNAPEITEDNTYLYSDLGGNKSAFYTGEITGSNLNIGEEYAVQENPYTLPTGIIDQNLFAHTDYNVLLNNVSSSILSLDRFKIETIPTYSLNYTNPQQNYITIPLPGGGSINIPLPITYDTYSIVNYNILTPVELQDSYESLSSYQLSRHEGVKLTGLKYNTFSTQSLTYGGDISYGNNAVIDRYSSKIGMFTSVDTSSVFLNKSDVTLKYLIDINGNITELNGSNYYWQDVQSIFEDSTLTVSLFDPKKYGNQRRLDGTKNIYSSGYSYSPILYYTGSDRYLYFRVAEGEDKFLFLSNQSPQLITSSIYTNATRFKFSPTFNSVVFNDLNLYKTGSSTVSSSFTSSYNGTYVFNTVLNYSFNGPTELTQILNNKIELAGSPALFTQAGGANFKFIVKSGATIYGLTGSFTPKKYLTYEDRSKTPYINDDARNDFFYKDNPYTNTLSNVDFYIYDSDGNQICQPGDTIYSWQTYDAKSTTSANTRVIFAVNNSTILGSNQGGAWNRLNVTNGSGYYNYFYPYHMGGNIYLTTPKQTTELDVNLGTPSGITLTSGSAVEFGFEVSGSNDTTPSTSANILPIRNFELNSGTLKALFFTSNGSTLYTITGSKIINFSGSNTISFTSSMYPTPINDGYYYPNTGSSLYATYGDVDYPLPPQKNDLIVFAPTDINKRKEFVITNTFVSNSIFSMEVTPQFYNLEQISSSFLILNRRPNETNIVLNTLKNPGQTSYGYVIPKDVNPAILNNINTINESIKNKLLADQQGNTTYQ